MIELLNFISENNFVRYKDGKWYRTGDIPRRFYTSEELVKLFEKMSLEDKISHFYTSEELEKVSLEDKIS